MTETYRRLPLTGLKNARELGGYPTKYGVPTKFGRFVRSEVPRVITDSDIEFIRNYGIRNSIDFRGSLELNNVKNLLQEQDFITFIHCPTFDAQVALPDRSKRSEEINAFVKWSVKYIEMLTTRKDWVCRAITAMANAEGGVMYNCTTGKDRTGMISALLLSIAGVDDEDIIADYAVSQIHMRTVYHDLEATLPAFRDDGSFNIDDPFFKTSPDTMFEMLEHLNSAYGSVEKYLLSTGLSNDVIETVRRKLLD